MHLTLVDFQSLAGIAFLQRLADANDCRQPGREGGLGLGFDLGIRLAMVGSPFGVPDYCVFTADILQHVGAGVAGVRPFLLHVAVLPSHGDAAAGNSIDDLGDKHEGWANNHVKAWRLLPFQACREVGSKR